MQSIQKKVIYFSNTWQSHQVYTVSVSDSSNVTEHNYMSTILMTFEHDL